MAVVALQEVVVCVCEDDDGPCCDVALKLVSVYTREPKHLHSVSTCLIRLAFCYTHLAAMLWSSGFTSSDALC